LEFRRVLFRSKIPVTRVWKYSGSGNSYAASKVTVPDSSASDRDFRPSHVAGPCPERSDHKTFLYVLGEFLLLIVLIIAECARLHDSARFQPYDAPSAPAIKR